MSSSASELAFTLERGRYVLDALVPPGSQPTSLAPPRNTPVIAGRPWFGEGAKAFRFASAASERTRNDADPPGFNGRDWLRPYHAATKAGMKGKSLPISQAPFAFAAAALGANGGLDHLIDQIHAAHYFSTPMLN